MTNSGSMPTNPKLFTWQYLRAVAYLGSEPFVAISIRFNAPLHPAHLLHGICDHAARGAGIRFRVRELLSQSAARGTKCGNSVAYKFLQTHQSLSTIPWRKHLPVTCAIIISLFANKLNFLEVANDGLQGHDVKGKPEQVFASGKRGTNVHPGPGSMER